MSIQRQISQKLEAEFHHEIALGNGSYVGSDGDGGDFVDLYISLPERYLGLEWQAVLTVKSARGVVEVPRHAEAYVSTEEGGTYLPAAEEEIAVPAAVEDACRQVGDRVWTLKLSGLAFTGREAHLFADLRSIMSARKAGSDAALDKAILSAWRRLSSIVPDHRVEIAPDSPLSSGA